MTYKLHKDFIVAVSKYTSVGHVIIDVVLCYILRGISLNQLVKIFLYIA